MIQEQISKIVDCQYLLLNLVIDKKIEPEDYACASEKLTQRMQALKDIYDKQVQRVHQASR